MPPTRDDGSSNWTPIKTELRRAVGESAEITAEIVPLLSEKSEMAGVVAASQTQPCIGRHWNAAHLVGSMFTEKKKKSMYLPFGEAILHRHNKGPLMAAAATVQ